MAVDASQAHFYTSGDDGLVASWDLSQSDDQGSGVISLQESVFALCRLADRPWLAVGSSIGNLYLVDLEAKNIEFSWRLNQQAIYQLYHHLPTGELWVLHGQGALSVLDVATLTHKKTLQLARNHLRAICAGLTEDELWIGSSDNQIFRLAAGEVSVLHQWEAHDNSVFALHVHPGGKYLISGGRDAHLRVWDLQQPYKEVRSIPAHNFTINALSFSPEGDHFVTASRDKTLKIWDAYSFELLKVVDKARNESHSYSVNRIEWLRDRSIISASDDKTAIRWNVEVPSS